MVRKVTLLQIVLSLVLFVSPLSLEARDKGQPVILLREIINMSQDKQNQYLTEAVKEICLNEIKTGQHFTVLEERDLPWLKSDLPDDKLYNLCQKYDIPYIISGYYYSEGNRITLRLKISSAQSRQVIGQKTNLFDIDQNIFFHIQTTCMRILTQLEEYTPSQDRPTMGTADKGRDKESEKFISRYEEEYFIYMSFSLNYTLVNCANLELNIYDRYNIDSPINKNIHTFSPQVSVEFYKSRQQHYIGGGLHIAPPIPLERPGFGTSMYMRFYGAFGYNKQYFFKWSFDYMSLNFEKYAKDLFQEPVTAKILYFGLGFDFTYLPQNLPFLIKGGVSLFPPFIPFVEHNSRTNESYPWLISLGKKISYHSFFVPLVARLGTGFFFTDNIGIELGYQLSFFHLNYAVLFNRDNQEYEKYLGNELALVHSISIGVVYKSVIK